MEQLDVFHLASYKVSRNNKATRMFYLERAVQEVLSKQPVANELDIFEKTRDVSPLQMGMALNWRPRCSPGSQEVHPIQHRQPQVLPHVVGFAVKLAGGQ